MSTLHDSSVGGDFTRGAQVLIHFLRMIGQVLRKFGGELLVLYSLVTIGAWLAQTEPYARYLGVRYVGIMLGMALNNGANAIDVERRDGSLARTTVAQFYESPSMSNNAHRLVRVWVFSMAASAVGMGVLLVLFLGWLFCFGAAQRREHFVRGANVQAVKPACARAVSGSRVGWWLQIPDQSQ